MDVLVKLGLCLLFSLYNNVTDWRGHRVKNQAVLLFCLAGLLMSLWTGGFSGMAAALAGGALMLCLFPLFALRMLGAGDVKALIAVGCMLGFPTAGKALLASILGGGVVAFFTLLIRRDCRTRLVYLLRYLKICLLSQKLLPYGDRTGAGGGFRFTFGITAGIFALLLQEIWRCFA